MIRPPHHLSTFQMHLEIGTFAKALPRICRGLLSLGKVGGKSRRRIAAGGRDLPTAASAVPNRYQTQQLGGDALNAQPGQPQHGERHTAKAVRV